MKQNKATKSDFCQLCTFGLETGNVYVSNERDSGSFEELEALWVNKMADAM